MATTKDRPCRPEFRTATNGSCFQTRSAAAFWTWPPALRLGSARIPLTHHLPLGDSWFLRQKILAFICMMRWSGGAPGFGGQYVLVCVSGASGPAVQSEAPCPHLTLPQEVFARWGPYCLTSRDLTPLEVGETARKQKRIGLNDVRGIK